MNTLDRIIAARKARISSDNPNGVQSEELRKSDVALARSLDEGKKADTSLSDAMARLRNS